jgi:hypothetical protein
MGAQAVTARRRPLLALLGVAAVAVLCWALLRLPVTQGATRNVASPPSQPADVVTNQPGEPPVIAPLDLAPTRVFTSLPVFAWTDLAGLDPGTIEAFSSPFNGIGPKPMTDQRRPVAEKLLQWVSEADVLGPGRSPFGTDADSNQIQIQNGKLIAYPPLQIRFRGGKLLQIQAEPNCFEGIDGCAILVGGEGQIPLRMRHTDLIRYMAAMAWIQELDGDTVSPLLPPSWQQPTRLTAEKVKAILAPTLAADGMQLSSLEPRTRLLQYQEASGRWSTSLASIWAALLGLGDPQNPRALLMVDDESGTLIFRQDAPASN